MDFVGGSYNLTNRNASLQRSVNLIPKPIEAGNEKSAWAFFDAPGLTLFATLGAECRGAVDTDGRCFAVAGSTLYEVNSDGTKTSLGTLTTSTGRVGMTYNTTQLVVGDNENLYIYTFSGGAFMTTAYAGNGSLAFLDQYVVFAYRSGQTFGWTALGDATSIDALDFASAEGAPDSLVGLIVDHREIILFGSRTVEVWASTDGSTVFARNPGAFIENGCAAWATVQKLDDSVYWLSPSGRVFRMDGYRAITSSTVAVEQLLRSGTDLAGATAHVHEDSGGSFYCLNVPGLDTTLCLDTKTGLWHDRAELVDGSYEQWRPTIAVRSFNTVLFGDADGYLYELDHDAHDIEGDTLARDRITPHQALQGLYRIPFGTFTLDCDRGTDATVMLRYSDDGGITWGPWLDRSTGAAGNYRDPVKWCRTGSAIDRIWHVRCTDQVAFNPVGATVE